MNEDTKELIITNKLFSSADIEGSEDMLQLLDWKIHQIKKVAIARMKCLNNENLVTKKHLISQEALLNILNTKIQILSQKQ